MDMDDLSSVVGWVPAAFPVWFFVASPLILWVFRNKIRTSFGLRQSDTDADQPSNGKGLFLAHHLR